jgi:hypothetical protein
MPAHFDQPGLHFAYPDNWLIDSTEETGALRSATVLAPGTAFWTISVYPADASPERLVESAVLALRQEYNELEIEEFCESYAGRAMAGCDVHFQYLDLTNTASIRWFREQEEIYVLVWQAEDREYDQHSLVFEAMAVSLLQNL